MDQNKYDGDVSHLNAYYTESFPVQVQSGVGGNTNLYSWTEQRLSGPGFVDLEGGRTGQANARELNNITMLSGTPFYARLFYEGVVSGNPFYVFQGASGLSGGANLDGGYVGLVPLVSGLTHLRFASGDFYLSGYQQSGTLEVYSVNQKWTAAGWSGGDSVDPIVSGMRQLRFDENAFTLSGFRESGSVDVFTNLKAGLVDNSVLVSGTYRLVHDQNHFSASGYQQSGAVEVYLKPQSIGSGYIISGGVNVYNTVITSGMILSGSQYWYIFVSGVLPATINRNLTEFVYPTILFIGDNSYSGHQFGRIMFSNASGGATSYTNISGDTTGLPSPLPFATQLDWQGQRNYHQGNGWFGPQPDLQTIDTDTVTWSGGVDATTQTIILQANVASGVLLTTKNVDGTDLVYPTKVVTANNNQPTTNLSGFDTFGRIAFTESGSANQLDWQGLRIFVNGSWYGPEPDFSVNPLPCADAGGSEVTMITATDNPASGVISLLVGTTGFTGSQDLVSAVSFSGGNCTLGVSTVTLTAQCGIITALG